jgi:hypothetical protein
MVIGQTWASVEAFTLPRTVIWFILNSNNMWNKLISLMYTTLEAPEVQQVSETIATYPTTTLHGATTQQTTNSIFIVK